MIEAPEDRNDRHRRIKHAMQLWKWWTNCLFLSSAMQLIAVFGMIFFKSDAVFFSFEVPALCLGTLAVFRSSHWRAVNKNLLINER